MSSQDGKMTDTIPQLASQPQNPEKMSEDTQPSSSVVEALPDIESSHTHPLGQQQVKAVEEPCDDSSSGSESESERDSKRVKLDDVPEATDGAGGKDEAAEVQEEEITFDLRMTWAGQGFDFRVQGSDRLYDFKASLSHQR